MSQSMFTEYANTWDHCEYKWILQIDPGARPVNKII